MSVSILQRNETTRHVEHQRVPCPLGSRERLQQSQVHQGRVAFQQPRGIGQVAQCRALTSGPFQCSLPLLLGLEYFGKGPLELRREHHVLHLDRMNGHANFGSFRLHAGEELSRQICPLREQALPSDAAKRQLGIVVKLVGVEPTIVTEFACQPSSGFDRELTELRM